MSEPEFDVRIRQDALRAAPETVAIETSRSPAMSSFRLLALAPENFEPLFAMSDTELDALGARRVIADAPTGFPCRVSLADADVGDELLLLPFGHLTTGSPYRSTGAIYVRRGVARATPGRGVVPPYVTRRLMSVRAYDAADMMIDADVCEGARAGEVIERMLSDSAVSFIHLHNARRGCFSCRVERSD